MPLTIPILFLANPYEHLEKGYGSTVLFLPLFPDNGLALKQLKTAFAFWQPLMPLAQ